MYVLSGRFCFLFFFVVLFSGCGQVHKEIGEYAWEQLENESEAAKENSVQKEFDEFCRQNFEETVCSDALTFHYLLKNPENFGITQNFPEGLGSYGIDQMRSQLAENENLLAKIGSFDLQQLSLDSQLTLEVMKSYLLQEQLQEGLLWYNEPLRPQSGIASQLPLLLSEYTFRNEKDVRSYLTLLNSVEYYFQTLAAYEKEKAEQGLFMSDEVLEELLEQLQTAVSGGDNNIFLVTFNEKVKKLCDESIISQKEKEQFIEENELAVATKVLVAYESLIQELTLLKGSGKYSGGLCQYPEGKTYYEHMIKSYTGSEKEAGELIDWLDDTIKERREAMKDAFHVEHALEEYDSYQFPVKEPGQILVYLEKAIKEKFPTLSGNTYELKHVPGQVSDLFASACYMTPALDAEGENVIYLNDAKLNKNNEIFPTLAHEGYPGHMLQQVYFQQKKENPIRYVMNFPGYEEGWGTYAEAYSYQLAGFSDALSEILSDDLILSLCIYARVDLGVNMEGWDEQSVQEYLRRLNLTDVSQAKELVSMAISEPCMYLKYIVGYLEILELKEHAKELWGRDYSEMRFHTFYLSMGPAPFEVMELWLEK